MHARIHSQWLGLRLEGLAGSPVAATPSHLIVPQFDGLEARIARTFYPTKTSLLSSQTSVNVG